MLSLIIMLTHFQLLLQLPTGTELGNLLKKIGIRIPTEACDTHLDWTTIRFIPAIRYSNYYIFLFRVFRIVFNCSLSGRKAQANTHASLSNRMSGPFKMASLEKPPVTSALPHFISPAASFTFSPVILITSFLIISSNFTLMSLTSLAELFRELYTFHT